MSAVIGKVSAKGVDVTEDAGLRRHYERCDPRAEYLDPTDHCWRCAECGEQLSDVDQFAKFAAARDQFVAEFTKPLRQFTAWLKGKLTRTRKP